MDYFYCPPDRISKTLITIDEDEFSHLTHVMRKKIGDRIRVVDGAGTAYDVELTGFMKKNAVGTILASYPAHNELGVSITLAVGVLKNPSRFDFLIEKVTELGVKEILPLRTERTIRSHANIDRWQKLALAAMKQSGRSFLPRVRDMSTLPDVIASAGSFQRSYIAQEQRLGEPAGEASALISGKTRLVLVGPEGGFSDEEVTMCVDAGCSPLYFGERRLRTETAAIVSMLVMQRS